MTPFCELLARSFPAGGPTSTMRRAVGGEDFDALATLNVLVPGAFDGRFPCYRSGRLCPKTVYGADGPHPFAGCSNDPPECEDTPLGPDDLCTTALSVEHFLGVLARLFSLDGRPPTLPVGPEVYRVGISDRPQARRVVYFTRTARRVGFRATLDGLIARAGGRSVFVCVPTRDALDAGLQMEIEGAALSFVVLAERLTRDGAELQLDLSDLVAGPSTAVHAMPPTRTPDTAEFCEIIETGRVRRRIGRSEYDRLVNGGATRYDLFVAGVEHPYQLSVLTAKGKSKSCGLTMREFTMLATLVGTDQPLIPKAFDPEYQGHEATQRLFERLRRSFDTELERRRWRFFSSVIRVRENLGGYRFAPVKGATFAVLLPLDFVGPMEWSRSTV